MAYEEREHHRFQHGLDTVDTLSRECVRPDGHMVSLTAAEIRLLFLLPVDSFQDTSTLRQLYALSAYPDLPDKSPEALLAACSKENIFVTIKRLRTKLGGENTIINENGHGFQLNMEWNPTE